MLHDRRHLQLEEVTIEPKVEVHLVIIDDWRLSAISKRPKRLQVR